jgi:hypothetical protein
VCSSDLGDEEASMAACAGPTLPGCAQGSRGGGERWGGAATRGGEDLVPATSGKGFPPPVVSLGQYDELSSHLRFFKRRLPIY